MGLRKDGEEDDEIAERNDFHLLKDIGVTKEEALREADKAFWRL